ncbi:GNAT family N-acetyltransferase [Shewanella sp. KT0246]|uniref:GNAT family N-acetyltransferase n=1 Tax=Shewanella sp. KT0246 TaxID=2815912 RepID=UPI001BC4D442|nr:GNAT family N-acetyltransferase [Shewanella sp. KT0246]GIU53902.1 N-acetyltransferase [Shewanella sp. KT0246]
MDIRVDDLSGPEIAELLTEHLQDMYATSPAESVHALDLDKLKQPNITFWTIWENDLLAGCGAINWYSVEHVEIKSMRVSNQFRRRGVAATLLGFMLNEVKNSGAQTVNLETGSMDFFAPARRLYARHGFTECGPFADYEADPNSVFMTRSL